MKTSQNLLAQLPHQINKLSLPEFNWLCHLLCAVLLLIWLSDDCWACLAPCIRLKLFNLTCHSLGTSLMPSTLLNWMQTELSCIFKIHLGSFFQETSCYIIWGFKYPISFFFFPKYPISNLFYFQIWMFMYLIFTKWAQQVKTGWEYTQNTRQVSHHC